MNGANDRSAQYQEAKTLPEKKNIVLADVRQYHGEESFLFRVIDICWNVLDRPTDFTLLMECYWSDLSFVAPEATDIICEKVQRFFEHRVINSQSEYIMKLIFGTHELRRNGINASSVHEFTREARGAQPDRPSEPLAREKVEFIVSMVCSEMVELLQTVLEPDENPVGVIRKLCDTDVKQDYVRPGDSEKSALIAEQADAMVDAMYYMYDTATRMGVNLDRVFNVVHAANMAKRGPDGQFVIRPSDGKIIKPEGWKEPNIVAEIEDQMQYGAWE